MVWNKFRFYFRLFPILKVSSKRRVLWAFSSSSFWEFRHDIRVFIRYFLSLCKKHSFLLKYNFIYHISASYRRRHIRPVSRRTWGGDCSCTGEETSHSWHDEACGDGRHCHVAPPLSPILTYLLPSIITLYRWPLVNLTIFVLLLSYTTITLWLLPSSLHPICQERVWESVVCERVRETRIWLIPVYGSFVPRW